MGLEDVGGQLSVVADVMLDTSGSEMLSWRMQWFTTPSINGKISFFPPMSPSVA